MELSLRVFLIFALIVYFMIIFSLLKKNKFGLKYALIWLFSGFAMILFTIFPEVVYAASRLIGVSNPVNAVFLCFALFTIILLITVTSINSQLHEKTLRLTQKLALLEKRVDELEKR